MYERSTLPAEMQQLHINSAQRDWLQKPPSQHCPADPDLLNNVQTVDQAARVGRVMDLVPRQFRLAAVGLALTGLASPAFAGGIMPGNGGTITLPAIPPPAVRESVLSPPRGSSLGVLEDRIGVQNGHLDFFSARPDNIGDFKPLLRGGFGEGGLKLQLKW